jgi:hypothetical protein
MTLEIKKSDRSSPTGAGDLRHRVPGVECLIKIDGTLQSCFRLLHVARNTRVAGEVKDNQSTLRIQLTRFEKNCFRLLDILGAPNCIGEVDSRSRISGSAFTRCLAIY